MSAIALNVRHLTSRSLVRTALLAATLSAILLLTSAARADVLEGISGNANESFSLEPGPSFTTDVRDLDFSASATYVNPIEISFSDPQSNANLQAGAGDTPYLIQAFLGDQRFDAYVIGFGTSPSYYGYYDDSLSAIQVKSRGTGTGPSFLLDNIEMTTLGSTVPEPNTLLLLSSAMLVLGVGLRCLFARD